MSRYIKTLCLQMNFIDRLKQLCTSRRAQNLLNLLDVTLTLANMLDHSLFCDKYSRKQAIYDIAIAIADYDCLFIYLFLGFTSSKDHVISQ